jgi:hypothetical protein
VFLSNQFALPATTICALYKARWQVELFFKWIKQHVHAKYRCQFFSNLELSVARCLGWAAGGRGAPGAAQRPTGARCTALETAPVV